MDIQSCFAGKGVLVTGATGFVGQVLVEKLLRCCPNIKTLYLLVRKKKEISGQERINIIFSNKLFSNLKKDYPNFEEKVKVLESDLTMSNFGLNDNEVHAIQEEVTIVMHAAACVKFNEKLKDAFKNNVGATRDLLELAKKIKSVKVFVLISTVYSQSLIGSYREQVPEIPIDYEKLKYILEHGKEEVVKHTEESLLENWGDTYSFTKGMAESVTATYCEDIPVVIFRPGIVFAIKEDPLAGWMDNGLMYKRHLVGFYSGSVHALICDPEADMPIVPVDMVAFAIIASAAEVLKRKALTKEVKVYNFAPAPWNNLTFSDFKRLLEKVSPEIPYSMSIGTSFLYLTKSKAVYMAYSTLFHYIPAFLMLIFSWIKGENSRHDLFKVYKKVDSFSCLSHKILSHSWKWEYSNIQKLWSTLSDDERLCFPFDIGSLNWETYFKKTYLGIREFILNDKPETLDKAISRYSRLSWINFFMKHFLITLFVFVAINFIF